MVHFVDTLSSVINSKTLSEDLYFQFLSTCKGKPADGAVVHLLRNVPYQLLLSMTYHCYCP